MPKRSQKNVPLHDDDRTRRKGSSGTIKSESGISQLHPTKQPPEISEPLTPNRRPSFGSSMKIKHISPGVAGAGQRDTQPIRFPKLEEYAHFHYDLVEIPTLKLSICADDASGYKHNPELGEDSGMFLVTVTGSAPKSWLIRRSLDNFATLDKQLHRCIFDRRFSHLEEINAAQLDLKSRQEIQTLLEGYLSHFSELAGGMVNCGSVLSWMEMDNRGHRLVATDDSGINTPAIAAAHVIKRYNAQAADEISLQVGDMISVIDMPASEDTIWWRGKRGFEVGFFPAECVEIIGDKVPFSMTTRIPEPLATAAAARRPCENLGETTSVVTSVNTATTTTTATTTSSSSLSPPPSPSLSWSSATSTASGGNISVSSAPDSPQTMMRKHGKLLSFLRTFFSHRPPRNQLKQSGIVKERVFGCDLGEHLLNSGHDVPLLLKSCTDIIEQYGIVHGIYRLSGITSNIQKLRLAFDEDRVPDLTEECYLQDIHSISSLLKMYFRELPNPLLTYQLYDKFADAVRDEDNKLLKIHDVVQQLPPPHYRTTEYLMRHLARVAAFGAETEMHSKNLAIVWAPNLLRSKELEAGGGAAALQGVGIQAVVTECLICYSDIIFSDKMPNYGSQEAMKGQKKPRPKSLAISTPTRLLSLEEARERAFISHLAPKKFIDVGGGPKNLPSKYHTVIDLPGYKKKVPSGSTKENKAGSKKGSTSTSCVGGGNSGGGSSGGWKSIFSKPRSGSVKKTRKSSIQDSVSVTPAQAKALTEEDVHNWKRHLRSAKSAESLFSLTHTSSPRGSIGSRVSQSNTDASSIDRQALDLSAGSTSMFRPTHKRSLSSDASAVLQHHYLSHDVPLESSPTDGEDGRQSFIRGDSTRRALHHRRVPSAPNTPRQDRRIHSDESTETDIGMANSSSDNMDLNIEEFMYPKSASKGDINIDAAIKSRLQQVAGKTRSAKSNEELASSPLKRSAKTSSKSRKKAKGVDDGQEGSSEDELSPGPVHPSARKVTKSSSNVSEMPDASPYDNDDRESRMRRFYSRFHDYAEILSDDDTGMAYTPDSQGTMSVSSSGCNMQDVLDQIDNRLAMNAKLFPRQGIGDTSTYRVGDPLSANNQNQLQHRETGFSSTGMETTTTSTTSPTTSNNQETSFSANRQINKCKETEFPATSDSSPIETSRQETVKRSSLQSQGSFSSSDVGRRSVEYISSEGGSGRSTQNAHKVTDSPSASAPSSTRVMRRHAEFIPSKKASSQDLQNLNKLLECLESEGDSAHAQPRRRSAEGQGSSRSTLDPSQAHHRHSHAHQHPSTQHSNFPNVEQIAGAGRMSKCLSVPSDIAKSLENVTESQSDMLSSVTISELSMSMNSFTNGVGDDGTVHDAGHSHRFGDSDPRRRRSTSLDSLTESDRLMTRTLREINKQMDVAFKHESFCGATSEMDKDSISHPQRLVASDLDLSTSPEVKAFTQSQFDQALAIAASRGNGRKNHGDARTDRTSRSGQTACGVDMFPDSRLQDQSKSASLPPLCLPAIKKLSSSNESLSDSDSDQDDSLMYVTGAASSTSVGDLNLLSPTSNIDGNLSFPRSGSDCMISANDTPSTVTNTPEVSPGGVQVGAAPHQSLSPLTHQQLASLPSKGRDKNVEKQTHHQKEDHVLVEVPHMIRAPPRGGKNVTGQGEGQHHHHHHHHQHQQHHHHHVAKPDQGGVKGRTDVANMCKNRSSSSSSVTSSDSEEFDEVASPDEDEQQLREKSKPNLSLPLGIVTGGGGQMYGNFPPHETAPGQVVRRQHSPRVESKSPRSPMRMPGFGEAAAQEEHRDVAEGDVNNLQWDSSPLFAGRNQMDEERISSLCAAGLVSQRARLSRESSNSSLQSPDSSLSNVLFNNPRSPLHTPVREALPDLIQSTTQVRDMSGDAESASNVPLQLALYHPDEFSMDISASVSGHGRPAAIVPSPSLPQVHSSMETVMVKQAVLRKSSTHDVISSPANSGLATGNDNQILSGNLRTVGSSNADVGRRKVDDRSGGGDFYRQRASSDSQAAHREARLPQTAGLESNIRHGYHGKGMSEENKRGRGAASGSQHVQKQYSYPTDKKMCNNSDDQVAMEIDNLCNKLVDDMNSPQNVQSRSRGCEEESKSYTVSASRDVRTDVNEQGAISMEVETSLEVKDAHSSPVVRERRVLRSASTDGENIETLMVSVQNSGGSVEDEVVQNVLNQGREILMSPTHSNESGYKEKLSGARSPPNTSTDSSGGGGDYSSPGRKSSISRIPRPRNISDLASSKSGSSGAGSASAKESSLHSSVHADTSPSSSSSSSSATSSSSRSRHVRRGSETSGVAGAKRQGHIRRSSDTKISELRTTSPMAQTQSLSPHKSEQTNISRNLPSPVGRIADSRVGPTDSSGKYSRIPLSHRVPSPQHADRGGGDAGNLGVAKQGSKIPSPVPKPRKTSFNSKSDPPAEEVMEVTRQSMRKEKSGKNGNGKDAAGKKETGSKKSVVIKGSQEKGGARLVIESQADLKKKIQTVHAKKVTQPPRQVAEAVERTDSTDAKLTCRSSSQNENDVTSEPVSTVMFADQTNIQGNSNDQSREKKIPPPVAKRKFHYDSRSLPRRSKFLENAVSFAQQTADCEQYSDMVGSRSSLDDSVLQLAAERHDLFEDAEGGECSGYTTGSLRAKRSQKMQSLVDLFERSSDSNMSDSSGSSPGTRHRDRTSSWSFQGQGGQLTPCMEVGRVDLDITDDDAFISTMSSSFDQQMLAHSNRQRPTQSRDRYSYTGGAGETLSGGLITSDKENLEEGARSRVDRKSHPPLSSSLSSPSSSAAVKQTTRNVSREPVDIRGRVSSPTRRKRNPDMPTSPRQPASYSQTASPDASKISKNSRPPRPRSSSKTRTQSESSASESDTTHQAEGSTVRFASSRHRAFSATSSSSHSPQLYSESHFKSTTHSSTIHQHQSSDSITGISTSTVHRQTDSQDVDSVLTTSQTSAAAAGGGNQSSTNYTSPQSSRKNSERRNSIKELRQVFERAEGDSTPCDPESNPADQGRPILRPRVRSTSPQAEGTSEQRPERSNVMRHSIEVSSPSSIQSAQGDVKSQPLRLGPKPFYGSQK